MEPAAASTSHSCPQCGARVTLPPDHISTLCSFCETPLVESGPETERVDLVAPFMQPRQGASSRLREYLERRWLAPAAVRSARPDQLKAVHVPFWVWDATARTAYTARVGLYWYRTETYWVTVNGKRQRRTRTVRETEWFSLRGTHVKSYQDHLTSGSRGLSEAESNALEPFDLGNALQYAPALVAGSIAEHPTVDHQEAARVAEAELASLEQRELQSFIPGDVVRDVRNDTDMHVEEMRLALLPVWMATYRQGDKLFRLVVNGQTGLVAGRCPTSPLKVALLVLVVLALGAGLLLLFLTVAG